MKSRQSLGRLSTSARSGLPNIAVVIATLGRPQVVSSTLRRILDQQTYRPSILIVSCADAGDVGPAANWPEITVVVGPPGLAAQRNTALAALPATIDIVTFFDDDFVPARDWLELSARLFIENDDLIGLTGCLLADGIKGPGLSFDEADRLLDRHTIDATLPLIEPYSPYGCNMAFRCSAIGNVRFDERLVLYGWLEDRDFGATLAAKGGRLVKCLETRGVHLGVKGGRIAGERLGYSQVVNPFYMLRKGTMTFIQVFDHVSRNFLSNLIRSIAPEPFIDRRGRLRGNLQGFADIIRGRFDPENALKVGRRSTC